MSPNSPGWVVAALGAGGHNGRRRTVLAALLGPRPSCRTVCTGRRRRRRRLPRQARERAGEPLLLRGAGGAAHHGRAARRAAGARWGGGKGGEEAPAGWLARGLGCWWSRLPLWWSCLPLAPEPPRGCLPCLSASSPAGLQGRRRPLPRLHLVHAEPAELCSSHILSVPAGLQGRRRPLPHLHRRGGARHRHPGGAAGALAAGGWRPGACAGAADRRFAGTGVQAWQACCCGKGARRLACSAPGRRPRPCPTTSPDLRPLPCRASLT